MKSPQFNSLASIKLFATHFFFFLANEKNVLVPVLWPRAFQHPRNSRLVFSAPVGSAFLGWGVLASTEFSTGKFLLLRTHKHPPYPLPINHGLGVGGKTSFAYLVFFFFFQG